MIRDVCCGTMRTVRKSTTSAKATSRMRTISPAPMSTLSLSFLTERVAGDDHGGPLDGNDPNLLSGLAPRAPVGRPGRPCLTRELDAAIGLGDRLQHPADAPDEARGPDGVACLSHHEAPLDER